MTNDRDQSSAGAAARFEFDRMTAQRFREAFPRARWSDEENAWIVPGKTAEHRIERWQALEASRADVYADAKGRDAFAFEPLASAYLKAGLDLVVATPYSKTVVEELRQVPYARWDGPDKVWRIPYRFYEELRWRWPVIEAAARRNEPEERRRRREEARGNGAQAISQAKALERRRRRYPIPDDDRPPLQRPVSTPDYGIIAVTGSGGELVDPETLERFYSSIAMGGDLIWSTWRSPSLEELVKTWPSRKAPTEPERARGWWQPTKPELVVARQKAKSMERRLKNR